MQLPAPAMFGLPSKFGEWRTNQDLACESIADPDPRFLVQVCPTGFGKSAAYMAASQLVPGRTVILTSTKGLQTQLMNDFGRMDGVVDIRGRGNYTCRMNTQVNCDLGPCVFGVRCPMRSEGGCFYFDQWKKALAAKVVITNYSYWMSQNEYGEGLGEFKMMILDEAHSAPDHLIDHISVSFSKRFKLECDMLSLDDSLPNDVSTWRDWASSRLREVRDRMEWAKMTRKEKLWLRLKRMVDKLERVEGMDGSWVWEDNSTNVILSPTWPAPYAEGTLFLGIPKVVLTSATVVPKTASLLGIEDHKYEEYPHSFPLENRPLIHLPTVRMNHRIGELENRLWINKLDHIIRDRLQFKGIIHTVSYARRDMVMERSKYREWMVTHKRKDTEETVRAFQKMDAPAILVSPSMATGWDFPLDQCRFQVIVKLPFPDTRGDIMKARSKDGEFIPYLVMQQLIQATGRGVRSEEDWCETFILDNNIQWFIKRYHNLTVEWFDGAYRVSTTIPRPRRK